MAKLTKKQFGAMGKGITTKAKEIRAKSPTKKWTSCIKEASKSFKKK